LIREFLRAAKGAIGTVETSADMEMRSV